MTSPAGRRHIPEPQLARVLISLDQLAVLAADTGSMSVDYYRAALLDACDLPADLLPRVRRIGAGR